MQYDIGNKGLFKPVFFLSEYLSHSFDWVNLSTGLRLVLSTQKWLTLVGIRKCKELNKFVFRWQDVGKINAVLKPGLINYLYPAIWDTS